MAGKKSGFPSSELAGRVAAWVTLWMSCSTSVSQNPGLGTIYANPTTKTPFKNASLHHLSGLCGSRVSWGILWLERSALELKGPILIFPPLRKPSFLILGTHCCIIQTPAMLHLKGVLALGSDKPEFEQQFLVTWAVLKKPYNLFDPVFSFVNGGKDNVVIVS